MTQTARTLLIGSLVLFIATAHPSFAQSQDELTALREELQALRAGQESMRRELQEIKNLLQGLQQSPRHARRKHPAPRRVHPRPLCASFSTTSGLRPRMGNPVTADFGHAGLLRFGAWPQGATSHAAVVAFPHPPVTVETK